MSVVHPCSVFLHVYGVLCLFYLTTCVCVCHSSYGPLRKCLRARRFRCRNKVTAPPSVCVPDVIGALVVWIQNKTKNKNMFASSMAGSHHEKSEATTRLIPWYQDRADTSEIPMLLLMSSAVTHHCHHRPALPFLDCHPFTKLVGNPPGWGVSSKQSG